jgi:outer membrane protein TolC
MRMNFGGESQTIKMGTDNSWNMGFSASVPVVAPQLWKQLQLSDTQIMANVESARASRLDLVNQVNQAYYALLLAYASKEVIQQNYDNAVLNASIYEKKFAVGTASEYDVLRSSVQVKNVEPELLQADIAIKQARLQLCILLGFDVSYEISTDMTLKQYQRDMFAYTSGLDRSIADNSSLRSLDIQTKALEQTVDLKKLAWAPTMAATFNYNWNSMSNGNMFKNISFNPYSSVGFSIAVPIFSGGSKYYGLKGAKVQLAEARLNRDNLVNSLNMQVDLAIDNINKEVSQIESSEEGVRQADKAYEIMQKSFEIGAATYLDLRDSELAQTSARLSYYQAIYNYLVSTSELDLLLGKSVAPSVTTK